MSVHDDMPMETLMSNLDRLVAKMDDLELDDPDANKDKIAKYKAKIKEYQATVNKKKSEAVVAKTEPSATSKVAPQNAPANPLGAPETKYAYNSMIAHFKANVPTLEPPLDVSIFVQRLQNCYNLFVKSLPVLEPYFVQTAKGYLSMDILENINASEDSTETFEELQTFLKKNYGSRETPFQLLNQLMELDIKEGEKIQEYAGRLERKTATVVTQIAAKFKNQESNKDGSPMNMSECFNLFSSMLLYDHLRKRRPNCFNLMVQNVDNCWKPSDLGSMAATLVDRMNIPEHTQAANQSFSARPNPKQQKHAPNKPAPNKGATSNGANWPKDVCYKFLSKGACNISNCERKHLSKGNNGYDHAMQLMQNGVTPFRNKGRSKPTSNTHVATTKPSLAELKPEDVGLEYFQSYYPKN